MEITIEQFRRDRKFGWGYSFTPTGEDAYSIEIPHHPDHVGTLNQIATAREQDRTWQARGGAFYNTAWFYNGMRILVTWGWGTISEPSPNEAADMTTDEWFEACQYGEKWLPGWHPPDDEDDVTIRVASLTVAEASERWSVPRATITWALRKGKIQPAQKHGNQWQFSQEGFLTWLAASK